MSGLTLYFATSRSCRFLSVSCKMYRQPSFVRMPIVSLRARPSLSVYHCTLRESSYDVVVPSRFLRCLCRSGG